MDAAARGEDPNFKVKVEEFVDDTPDSLDDLEEIEIEEEVIINGRAVKIKKKQYRKKVKKMIIDADGNQIQVDDYEIFDEEEVKKKKEEKVKKRLQEQRKKQGIPADDEEEEVEIEAFYDKTSGKWKTRVKKTIKIPRRGKAGIA